VCKFRRVVGRPVDQRLDWWAGRYARADECLFDGRGRGLRSWWDIGPADAGFDKVRACRV
jgi:hypothetical protein